MDTKPEADVSSDSEEEDEEVALAEVHRCQKVVRAGRNPCCEESSSRSRLKVAGEQCRALVLVLWPP